MNPDRALSPPKAADGKGGFINDLLVVRGVRSTVKFPVLGMPEALRSPFTSRRAKRRIAALRHADRPAQADAEAPSSPIKAMTPMSSAAISRGSNVLRSLGAGESHLSLVPHREIHRIDHNADAVRFLVQNPGLVYVASWLENNLRAKQDVDKFYLSVSPRQRAN